MVLTIAFVAFSPPPARESPLCCGAGAFAPATLKVAVICGALSFLSFIKPAVMRLLNKTNAPAIFVGDGFSDRYAVESADLVLAKDGLAAYCTEQSIEHTRYQNLGEVATHIDRWLAGRVFLREETQDRVS